MCDIARDHKYTNESGISVKEKYEMHGNLFDITLGYNF